MPGLTDARVEELNADLAILIPRMRRMLDRLETATNLADGHAAIATLTMDVASANFGFTQARMPAFGRISI